MSDQFKIDILNEIRAIIAHLLVLDDVDVQPEMLLKEDLDIDSLDFIEIMLALESIFDIEIEEEEAETLKTVEDLINIVESKKDYASFVNDMNYNR